MYNCQYCKLYACWNTTASYLSVLWGCYLVQKKWIPNWMSKIFVSLRWLLTLHSQGRVPPALTKVGKHSYDQKTGPHRIYPRQEFSIPTVDDRAVWIVNTRGVVVVCYDTRGTWLNRNGDGVTHEKDTSYIMLYAGLFGITYCFQFWNVSGKMSVITDQTQDMTGSTYTYTA